MGFFPLLRVCGSVFGLLFFVPGGRPLVFGGMAIALRSQSGGSAFTGDLAFALAFAFAATRSALTFVTLFFEPFVLAIVSSRENVFVGPFQEE
jgi:hypothetical protein